MRVGLIIDTDHRGLFTRWWNPPIFHSLKTTGVKAGRAGVGAGFLSNQAVDTPD